MKRYSMLFKYTVVIILLNMSLLTKPLGNETIREIVAKHKLDLEDLKAYYCHVQMIAHYIFDMMHQPGAVELHDQLRYGIVPERFQVEANGGVAFEVYHDLPRGLWTPLGFLPINEGGIVIDEKQMTLMMELLTAKLMLTKIKGSVVNNWDSKNYIYSVGQDLVSEPFPVVKMVSNEKMIIPFDAYQLWSKVKPTERAVC